MALEARAHPRPWTRAAIEDELGRADGAALGLVDGDGALVGHCLVRRIVDEAWVMEIAVDPAARRCGHGRALLDEAERRARAWGTASLWLEVRAQNDAARGLYARCGFVEQGVRRGYYPAEQQGGTPDDAVLMAKPLTT